MNSLRYRRLFIFSTLFFLFTVSSQAGRNLSDEVELIRKADNFFSQRKYGDALPHYSRLLSVNPEKTKYIYRFGVCLLMAGKEKSNAATFLYLAAKDSLAPPDVFYFLGRGYLLNNEFKKAQKAFETFKKKEKPNQVKDYNIDAYLRNCENGIRLSSQRKNVIIIGSNQLPEQSFYKNFDFSSSAGRIVSAADEFLTSLDKNRQKDPVMFVSNDRNTVYVPTYGKKGENGKDIYVARKAANNTWAPMENLGNTINTPADEDFPFLDLDGKTLYFSSNGSKSIGGYDIFKSEYNSKTHQWSEPENLGIPINTSGDDFLFVPGPDGRSASYTTTEESEKNSVSIRKVRLPAGNNQTMVTITGVFLPLDQKVRRDARITILTSQGDGIITSVHTDPQTGSYRIVVPSGDTYTILVEGGGYVPHAELFEIPSDLSTNDLKQVVKLDKQNQQERLILQNYFSSGITATVPTNTFTRTYPSRVDSSALVNISIEGKSVFATAPLKDSKSDAVAVTTDEVKSTNQSDTLAADTKKTPYLPQIKIKRRDKFDPTMESAPSASILHQQEEESARKDEIKEEENSPDVIFNTNISNKELSEIVYEDAVTLENEADSLYREAGIIRKLASEKEDLSKTFRMQAEEPGLPADSSKALIESSESNAEEAAELNAQADQLKMLASELANEAIQSVAEANEMFQNDNGNGALASTGAGIKYTSKYSKADVIAMREEPVKPVNQQARAGQSAVNEKQDPIQSDKEEVAMQATPVKPDVAITEPTAKNKITTEEVNKTEPTASNKITATEKAPEKSYGSQQKSEGTSGENPIAINETVGEKKELTSEKGSVKNTEPVVSNSKPDANVASSIITTESSRSVTAKTPETEKPVPSVQANTNNNEQNQVVAVNVKTEKPALIAKEHGQVVSKNVITETPASATKDQTEIVASKESSPKEKIIESENDATTSTGKGSTADNAQAVSSQLTEPAKNPVSVETASNSGNSTIKTNEAGTAEGGLAIAEKQPESVIKADTEVKSSASNQSVPELRMSDPQTTPTNVKTVPEKKSENEAIARVSKSDQSKNDIVKVVTPVDNKKLVKGEEPRQENSVSTNQDGVAMTQPVNQDALLAYREYQRKMQRSNELTAQSLQIQNQLDRSPFTPERDSLVRASNEMSLQSIREWQEAQQKIKVARSIEPGIDYKMSVNDYSASTQLSNGKNANTGTTALTPVNSTENEEATAVVLKPVLKTDSSNSTGNASVSKADVAVSGSATKNTADTKEDEKIIDTTHTEYPTYVKLKEEINNKQEQTISDFAVAMNLNKKSSEEKDMENSLRDKAQVTTDSKKKAEMLKQADELKKKSEQHEKESLEKFSKTKDKINNVKALNSDLAMVKDRISKTPEKETTLAINGSPAQKVSEKAVVETTNIAKSNAAQSEIITEKGMQQSVDSKVEEKKEYPVTKTDEVKSPVIAQVQENVKQENPDSNVKLEPEKQKESGLKVAGQTAVSTALAEKAVSEKSQPVESDKPRVTDTEKAKTVVVENNASDQMEIVAGNTSNKLKESPKQVTASPVVVKPKVKPLKLTSAANNSVAGKELSEKPKDQQAQAPVFAKANSKEKDLSLSEEEIAAVSVSKKESDEVLKNIFSINGVSSTSKVNEIPMDPQLPDGLVFKVQISAFRKPIAADNFNGIEPLTGESTRPGWIRYCVGMFKTFEPANVVKKEIRKIGYKDAFVVAYYNGKRIELNEAYRLIKGQENLTAYKSQSAKEMAILRSINITPDKGQLTDDRDEMAFYGIPVASVMPAAVQQPQAMTVTNPAAKNIREEKGEYAVQVGVYHRSKAPEMLASVKDVRSEKINSGLYRFTSGKFPDYASAEVARNRIREQGIKDAFIVLYREGKSELASEKNTDLKSMASGIVPKENGLTIKPSAITAELRYKVQIGAYKNNVPFDMIEAYIAINDKGISTQLDERDLHIFYAGEFSTYKEAESLRAEIISKGVKDAFVVAIQNGKRVVIQERMK